MNIPYRIRALNSIQTVLIAAAAAVHKAMEEKRQKMVIFQRLEMKFAFQVAQSLM